jgi:hypothetical protein
MNGCAMVFSVLSICFGFEFYRLAARGRGEFFRLRLGVIGIGMGRKEFSVGGIRQPAVCFFSTF